MGISPTQFFRSMHWDLPIMQLSKNGKRMLLYSHSVLSHSLWSHGLQQARFPCPSPSPRSCSNSCPSVGDAIQPSCPLLSSSPPAPLPASGSFLMSQLFILGGQSIGVSVSVLVLQMNQFLASGGQSIGVSASTSVLPMNIQDWFPLGCTGWISLLSKGLSRVFSNTIVQNHQFFGTQPSLRSSSHIHTWLLKKTIVLTVHNFVGKVMSLLFNVV